MDHETNRELSRISARTPKNLTDKLIKQEIDDSEEDVVRNALASKDLSPATKNDLRIRLARGDFRQVNEVVDPKIAAEIDKFTSQKVKEGLRSGRLKDPMQDPWYRKRMQMIKNHK